jgi:hypothetical protein
MTSTSPKRIVILPLPEGDVVARLIATDGEFSQIPSGEIYFTYCYGERRRWYVNKSIAAFREAVAIFNRFCEVHADDEDTDDDAAWSLLSSELRREFEQIEPLGDPEASLWSATIHDTEWGLLSLC